MRAARPSKPTRRRAMPGGSARPAARRRPPARRSSACSRTRIRPSTRCSRSGATARRRSSHSCRPAACRLPSPVFRGRVVRRGHACAQRQPDCSRAAFVPRPTTIRCCGWPTSISCAARIRSSGRSGPQTVRVAHLPAGRRRPPAEARRGARAPVGRPRRRAARALERFWHAWNGVGTPDWADFWQHRAALDANAARWADALAAVGDLAGKLAEYAKSQLK